MLKNNNNKQSQPHLKTCPSLLYLHALLLHYIMPSCNKNFYDHNPFLFIFRP